MKISLKSCEYFAPFTVLRDEANQWSAHADRPTCKELSRNSIKKNFEFLMFNVDD